jgi:hypothetical protein
MLRTALIFCCLICLQANAQINRVLNPSFEDFNSCPTSINQIQYVNNWRSIDTTGSQLPQADYFNICSATMQIPNPSLFNFFSQYPKSGNALVGFQTFSNFDIPEMRDYLLGKFDTNLVAGHQYQIITYTVLTELVKYACNGIGIFIGSTMLDTITTYPQALTYITPNVYSAVINDTANWNKIETIFTANGSEKRILIGNFFNDSTTQYSVSNPNSNQNYSQYLLDDVAVIDCTTLPFGGHDTIIAIGDSVFLGRPYEPVHIYNWYSNGLLIDSNIGFWAKPTQPTTYILQQTLCNTILYDTVFVNVSGHVNTAPNNARNEAISIFPNPNNGNFVINYKGNITSPTFLTITDVCGKEIDNIVVTNATNNYQNNKLTNGLYFYSIKQNNNELSRGKIVVQK